MWNHPATPAWDRPGGGPVGLARRVESAISSPAWSGSFGQNGRSAERSCRRSLTRRCGRAKYRCRCAERRSRTRAARRRSAFGRRGAKTDGAALSVTLPNSLAASAAAKKSSIRGTVLRSRQLGGWLVPARNPPTLRQEQRCVAARRSIASIWLESATPRRNQFSEIERRKPTARDGTERLRLRTAAPRTALERLPQPPRSRIRPAYVLSTAARQVRTPSPSVRRRFPARRSGVRGPLSAP